MQANAIMNLRGVMTVNAPVGELVTDARLQVVGLSHDGRADLCRQVLIPGLVVFLEREPDNPADRNAVKVVLGDGATIGYLTKQVARILASELDAGIKYDAHIDTLTDLDIDYILPEVIISIVRSTI